MLALVGLVLAGHLSGGGLSIALPAGWDGRVSLLRNQATLRASNGELDLELAELGNRPGTSGFLPVRRLALRPQDLRTPQLAVRRVAVHGRSFLITADLPDASRLGSANDVLARVRISWPAGLAPAARRRFERPLRLPRVRHGARCPTSRVSRAARGVGATLGRGPAYPVLGGAIAGANKTLWAVAPRYRGALLIRGRRLDGRGVLRFWPSRTSRMWWRGLWQEERPRWRYGPSTTLVPSPGCYAFQVDGTTFSSRIVFEVRSP
ncbi:MAG TPA: hypothetical protein VE596_15365 [Gaiellaceae bacterium]|nr:hypothetical protein [Gaiellaceae bacterium]